MTSLPALRASLEEIRRDGCLRDRRRAGAGRVRDRGARLRPLRPRRGCLCDRRAHGAGRARGPDARHRGDGDRADALGGARAPRRHRKGADARSVKPRRAGGRTVSDIDTGDAFRRAGAWRRRRRTLVLVLLGVVVVVVGAYGVRLWRYWDRHVSTDDAFVEAHVSPVSARVRGTVVQVLVRDNEEVRRGRAARAPGPARSRSEGPAGAGPRWRRRRAGCGRPPRACPMTDGSTRSQVALAEATAAKAALGIDSAQRVIDERRSRLLARRAAVQATTADVAARQADFERAGLDRGRMHELLERGLIAASGVRSRGQRVQDGGGGPRGGAAAPRRRARRGGPGRGRAGHSGGGARAGGPAARGRPKRRLATPGAGGAR